MGWNHAEDWAVFPVDWVNMPLLSQHIVHGPLAAAVYIPRKELKVGVVYGCPEKPRCFVKVVLVRVKPHAVFSF